MEQATRRLLARHAQLQHAIRQDDPKDVARAASRARLAKLELLPAERAASRRARAMVGHALREARLRANQPQTALVAPNTPARKRVARRWRIAAIAVAAAVLVVALLLQSQPPPVQEISRETAGGAPAGALVALAVASENSRGRTGEFVAIPVQSAPPEATVTPSPAPSAAAPIVGSASGSPSGGGGPGGAGGAGGGTGTGVGAGSASDTASPTPRPTPTPIPPVANGYTRIRGRVIDPATGQGVAGVCLVPGSLECDATKPYSDANGYFAIDVTTGAFWDIRFQASGYRVARIRVFAGGTEINVGNIRIAKTS